MRLPFARARRHAARGEEFAREYELPGTIRSKLAREHPELDWGPVETGLREWLVLCAHRGRAPLGMPSRAVDLAWHAFILDTSAYREFCDRAYAGRFLHHVPDDSFSDDEAMLRATIKAWDRTMWSRERDSTLWGLDDSLGLDAPWGVSIRALHLARRKGEVTGGWADGPLLHGTQCGGVGG